MRVIEAAPSDWPPCSGARRQVDPGARATADLARQFCDGGGRAPGRQSRNMSSDCEKTDSGDETSRIGGERPDCSHSSDGVLSDRRVPDAGSARSAASNPSPASSSASPPRRRRRDRRPASTVAKRSCAFSPDGTVFYGCDYNRGLVRAADRGSDGTYGPATVAVDLTERRGRRHGRRRERRPVGGARSSWLRGTLHAGRSRSRPSSTAAAFVASLCFGGSDGRDLFVTTAGRPRRPGRRRERCSYPQPGRGRARSRRCADGLSRNARYGCWRS